MATIVVQHRINDPEKFFGLTEEVTGGAPAGVRPRQFCPSEDKTAAVCLWEADTLDGLREYLDSMAGAEVTENTTTWWMSSTRSGCRSRRRRAPN
jgi:hypothetical protein